ncbi:Gfo/Idh/MocA family oxidoreductase [Streptomyces sp. NPDC059525]|uniref:Gfo/Idh/MocA family oxidoreductase n=1 Tax=Streptomyces sp. NPDC059525 TaxID=3346857 RepID=UPI0036C1B1C6
MPATPRPINVLLVGGCGHWAATENHVPAILTLQRQGFPVRVSAICDPRDPYDENLLRHMPDLLDLLRYDRPQWIRPGQSPEDLERRLDAAHASRPFDVVIVACDPVAHYPYLRWATRRGIHVLCDKPILATADAAWDPHAAATIDTHFDTLLKAHLDHPGHLFAMPMRRRANDAFVDSSHLITEVYEKHGQALTMANFTVTGGHFRLPEEYGLGNAHGYTHGVGALAFSSYHYIDLMAWYLRLAQGPATAVRITNHYVRRVGDYLATGQNRALENLLRPLSPKPAETAGLDRRTALAEMDFAFTLELLDDDARAHGYLTYTFTSNSYSHRQVGLQEADRAGHLPFREKGRMSQFVIDLHQGPLQHVRVSKNDVVGDRYRIRLEHRRNPLIDASGGRYADTVYENAHSASTVTPQAMTAEFLRAAAGCPPDERVARRMTYLVGQTFTQRIYAAMYRLIAARHEADTEHRTVTPSLLIGIPR